MSHARTSARPPHRHGSSFVITLLISAGAVLTLPAQSAHASERDRANYIQHCAGCHQMDGSGAASGRVPDMRGVVGHFLRTPEGRAFLVKVPGSRQSQLKDDDLAALLNWLVRTLSPHTAPADFTPYSAAEVRAYRAAPLDDVSRARARILGELAAQGFEIR